MRTEIDWFRLGRLTSLARPRCTAEAAESASCFRESAEPGFSPLGRVKDEGTLAGGALRFALWENDIKTRCLRLSPRRRRGRRSRGNSCTQA